MSGVRPDARLSAASSSFRLGMSQLLGTTRRPFELLAGRLLVRREPGGTGSSVPLFCSGSPFPDRETFRTLDWPKTTAAI